MCVERLVEYLSAFLSDSESSFLGAVAGVFDTDLDMDGVKKSSSSDIESNIPPTLFAKEKTNTRGIGYGCGLV